MQVYLLQARKEAGLTQAELAKKIGISEVAYRQKEQGKRDFKLNECYKIAKIFKKDIGDLFTDTRPRNVF